MHFVLGEAARFGKGPGKFTRRVDFSLTGRYQPHSQMNAPQPRRGFRGFRMIGTNGMNQPSTPARRDIAAILSACVALLFALPLASAQSPSRPPTINQIDILEITGDPRL